MQTHTVSLVGSGHTKFAGLTHCGWRISSYRPRAKRWKMPQCRPARSMRYSWAISFGHGQ